MKICVDGPRYVGEYYVQTYYKPRVTEVSADETTTFHLLDKPGAAKHAANLLRETGVPSERCFIYTERDVPEHVSFGTLVRAQTEHEAFCLWYANCERLLHVWPVLDSLIATTDITKSSTKHDIAPSVGKAVLRLVAADQVKVPACLLDEIGAMLEKKLTPSAPVETKVPEHVIGRSLVENPPIDTDDEVLGLPSSQHQSNTRKRKQIASDDNSLDDFIVNDIVEVDGSDSDWRESSDSGDDLAIAKSAVATRSANDATRKRARLVPARTSNVDASVLPSTSAPAIPATLVSDKDSTFHVEVDELREFLKKPRANWPETRFYTRTIQLLETMLLNIGVASRTPILKELFRLIGQRRVSLVPLLAEIRAVCWLCGTTKNVCVREVIAIDWSNMTRDETAARFPLFFAESSDVARRRFVGATCYASLLAIIRAYNLINDVWDRYRSPADERALRDDWLAIDALMTAAQTTNATVKK